MYGPYTLSFYRFYVKDVKNIRSSSQNYKWLGDLTVEVLYPYYSTEQKHRGHGLCSIDKFFINNLITQL